MKWCAADGEAVEAELTASAKATATATAPRPLRFARDAALVDVADELEWDDPVMNAPPLQLDARQPRPDHSAAAVASPARAADKQTESTKGSRLLTASWVAALLIFASLTFYSFAPWRDNSKVALPGAYAHQSAASLIPAVQRETAPRTRAIEDVRVADRTLGRNPRVSEVERASFDDIDPATWRHLLLTMVEDDGGRLDIELLRSRQWIEASQAKAGGLINLDLPEMGAEGRAQVQAVKPCPRIKPGKGQVVTGTFVHHSAEVIDLQIEGESKPIGVTSKHPFWSEDRQDFIPAGELREGERVNAVNGYEGVARVASIVPRAGPQKVYNLEVYGEHVYRVGDGGVLIHNSCPKTWNQFQAATKGQFASRAETAIAWRKYKAANGIVTGVNRNAAVRKRFLKSLADDPNTPSWLKQWLKEGKTPPGYEIDHKIPLSVGGADKVKNMRLQAIDLHRLWHKRYRPWDW